MINRSPTVKLLSILSSMQATFMEAAKIVSKLLVLSLFLLCLAATASSGRFHPLMPGPFIPHDYTRFADVERQCRSVLSSAGELSIDADRAGAVMHQLSFSNGDWSQDAGQAPLMPFHGSRADTPPAAGAPGQLEPVSLVSFMLTHMDTVPRRGSPTALNVSGFLSFTITRGYCCPSSMEPRVSPEFVLRPGYAELHIVFEGVYAETRSPGTDAGERVLCMVGNAVLPVRGSNSTDPWVWAKVNNGAGDGGSGVQPPVTADDNILLVLRYPKANTLTTRAVLGEMVSTSATSDGAYFDAVRLVSRLNMFSGYQFRPADDELAVAGCSQHQASCAGAGGAGNDCAGHLYRGPSFCDFLEQFTRNDNDVLDVVPDGGCNSTDEFCSRLGPFETAAAAVAVQDLRCEPTGGAAAAAAARVSAVFRPVGPWEHPLTAARRTGLSGATLSAEGAWSASTGRLCMVGCLGVSKGASASCDHRVSLHVATAFSIARRGIVVGEIASSNGSGIDSPALTFQQVVSPDYPWNQFGPSEEPVRMVYTYTKADQAGELLRRREPSGFRDSFVARWLLRYPMVAGDDMMSLSNLARDLSLHSLCGPKLPFLPDLIGDPVQNFHLQILSAGPLVGSFSPPSRRRYGAPVTEKTERGHGVEKHQILNVSAYFTASSGRFSGWAAMPVEGVYNPANGRMYLIGCRSVAVEAPRRVSSTSGHLEDGMDCSVEVTVEYPPTTTRWLASPAAKVHVASARDAGDPLHFDATALRSPPVNYRDQRDLLTEHTVEKVLCIAMLSAAIAATVSQLRHLESHAGVAPYVSLAMLGVQALGYGVTLVTDAKMLPAWPSYNHRVYTGHLRWDMDSTVKALALAALLLTARLARKVRRARARARARSPREPGRVPSDAAVLLYTVGVHLCGLFFVLAVHRLSTSGASWSPEPEGEPSRLPPSRMRTPGAVVERYVGVVKEWFLLPQVIGNAVWSVNCKPLAGRYYAGVTAVWLLPHVYGYLRPPAVVVVQPLVQNDVMDFYARACDVVVPVVGVVLAIAVYVQQRWNYKIVAWAMMTDAKKLQHMY
ncbi:hypothetical protein ACP4OV_018783 [Aristida adscensionis]